MLENDLDVIVDKLDRARRQKRDIQLANAQAEIKTIEREYLAYYDGAYDAIKAVKAAMAKGGEG